MHPTLEQLIYKTNIKISDGEIDCNKKIRSGIQNPTLNYGQIIQTETQQGNIGLEFHFRPNRPGRHIWIIPSNRRENRRGGPEINPYITVNWFSVKMPKTHNGESKICLMNADGKTGNQHGKQNRTSPHTTYKNQVNMTRIFIRKTWNYKT